MVDKELSKNKNIQNPEYMNELFVSKNYDINLGNSEIEFLLRWNRFGWSKIMARFL